MKRSIAKQIVLTIIEFVLIVFMFWVAGQVRMLIPFGKVFAFMDVQLFLPVSIAYAAIIVLCYLFTGSYRTVHFSGLVKETMKLVLVNLLGFGLMAGFLFVFKVDQFSRILLVYFYILSVAAIVIFRLVLNKVEIMIARQRQVAEKTLVYGDGFIAERFLSGASSTDTIEIVGKVSNIAEFRDFCKNNKEAIDRIVVASDSMMAADIDEIMIVAERYGITCSVIPIFGDYISTMTKSHTLAGCNMMDMYSLQTCEIMGVDIAVSDMERTLRLIDNRLMEWKGHYICASNVHTTVTAHEDEQYRKVQNGAVMALADGGPLSAYSRERGFEEARRVTGPDLMKNVLAISEQKGWSHYFYGSTQETLDDMKENLLAQFPKLKIAGMYSPPFRALSEEEDAKDVAMINESGADFLWVGLGAPKQELWMAAHEGRVNSLMVGVGAAFDYEAGNISRAPKWMQDHSLEWLYRLMQDPVRLFKRYVITNAKYLWWKLWE